LQNVCYRPTSPFPYEIVNDEVTIKIVFPEPVLMTEVAVVNDFNIDDYTVVFTNVLGNNSTEEVCYLVTIFIIQEHSVVT